MSRVCHADDVDSHGALTAAYTALLDALAAASDAQSWDPTRCAGWSVQDLVHHLLSDAQRALVALHTPASAAADTDEVSYWQSWQPDTEAAERNRRATRILASVWTFRPVVELYAETARAVLVACGERSGSDVVQTQGHRLSVNALRSTLAVEATVHHLDLGFGRPASVGLAEVRGVLDGLLGQSRPDFDDVRYALVGTGRAPLSETEVARLGPLAARFPLFG